MQKRRELRLIIASATLEAQKLKDFFNMGNSQDKDSSVIMSVEGRQYPVDIFYIDGKDFFFLVKFESVHYLTKSCITIFIYTLVAVKKEGKVKVVCWVQQ